MLIHVEEEPESPSIADPEVVVTVQLLNQKSSLQRHSLTTTRTIYHRHATKHGAYGFKPNTQNILHSQMNIRTPEPPATSSQRFDSKCYIQSKKNYTSSTWGNQEKKSKFSPHLRKGRLYLGLPDSGKQDTSQPRACTDTQSPCSQLSRLFLFCTVLCCHNFQLNSNKKSEIVLLVLKWALRL